MPNEAPVDVASGTGSNPYQEVEERRMIGDFESSANALWSLYGKEAKSHDESRIQKLKKDMDGVVTFVRYNLCIGAVLPC